MPVKATTAAGAAGLGGAIATVIIALWWPNADATVAVALTTIANAALAGLGAYFPKMEQL